MKFFQNLLRGATPERRLPELKLAIAQLLLEIARSDLKVGAEEIGVVRRHLGAAFGLDESQLDGLLADASAGVDHAVSLYDTVKSVNEHCSAEEKAGLIRALWQVAYADGRLDPYEEALLRRVAELLHVPHHRFIREKLGVMGGSGAA